LEKLGRADGRLNNSSRAESIKTCRDFHYFLTFLGAASYGSSLNDSTRGLTTSPACARTGDRTNLR
jgi:hypothetical protein